MYEAKDRQAWTFYMCPYGSRVTIGVPATAVTIPQLIERLSPFNRPSTVIRDQVEEIHPCYC